MRCILAQINTTVGDLAGNAAKVAAAFERASVYAPDLVIFPAMTLSGYPPEDLLRNPGFLAEAERTLQDLAPRIDGNVLLGYPSHPFFTGHPRLLAHIPAGSQERPRNTAVLLSGGRIAGEYHKSLFPDSEVFPEKHYFAPGTEAFNITLAGSGGRQTFSVVIGEEAWADNSPAADATGADAVICLAATPFHRIREGEREEIFARFCRKKQVPLLYCNLTGGQDDLIFGGASLMLDSQGRVAAQAAAGEEDLLVCDVPEPAARVPLPEPAARPTVTVCVQGAAAPRPPAPAPAPQSAYNEIAAVYSALVLGVRDYVRKNGFPGCIIGLSGGIDSALTAAIAVDALGKENVFGVTMPSRYSSAATKDDARILADNLGIRFASLPIEQPFAVFEEILSPLYAAANPAIDPENLTGQNLQARIRAVYLMALSNKYGLLLLNTSNKTEAAVGYGTLYGDMAGGYAVLKDVFKTDVWKLSYHVNERHGREVIPVSTITRTPSAELRENQEDRQSLPDYPVLDPILELYVEQDRSFNEITAAGYDGEIVRRIIRLVDRSEYKRRQSAFGPRVSPKAGGQERRLPVTNKFRP